MGYLIGVDVGGTHTDLVATDGQRLEVAKVSSTPLMPMEAITNGLGVIAGQLGLSPEELLTDTDRFLYGSTIATNLFISHRTAKVGLLCTKGFRDSLWFRDGYKPERWDLHYPPLWTIVPRYLRLGVEERVNYKGEVLVPLNTDDVVAATRKFREKKVEAVAICFLWSFFHPEHEQRAKDIVERELPGIPVVISYDVLPVIREWERTFCTALSAAIIKEVGTHLRELREELMKRGLKREPLIMKSDAGVANVGTVLKSPISLVASGPPAGAVAGIFYGESWDAKDVLTMDIGGTSFDVCLLPNRRIPMTKYRRLEHEPIAIPCADIHTIGAGGGSIAWLDRGGALQVGPDSAGADPGPACYGKGGEEPTVTDAYLLLGWLNPDFFLGGTRKLYPELAEKALGEKISKPLGMDLISCSARIAEIINSKMIDAMRLISIQRGIDPISFTLVTGGGAGPMAAGRLAESLGIRRVIIPRQPGGLCALGMVQGNIKHEAVATYATDTDRVDLDILTQMYEKLELESQEIILAQGIPKEKIEMARFIDARYRGQVYEVETSIPRPRKYRPEDLRQIVERFESEHDRLYHYRMPGFPVEFVSCRVEAIGKVPPIQSAEIEPAGADATAAVKGRRKAYSLERGKLVDIPVYDSEKLQPGNVVDGFSIVESSGSTLIVWENEQLTVGKYGDFCLECPTSSKV